MQTLSLGVTELTPAEMATIDGGVDPVTIAVAAYLVGSFLAGVSIGIALAE